MIYKLFPQGRGCTDFRGTHLGRGLSRFPREGVVLTFGELPLGRGLSWGGGYPGEGVILGKWLS